MNSCETCPWRHPETCKVCKQNQKKEEKNVPR